MRHGAEGVKEASGEAADGVTELEGALGRGSPGSSRERRRLVLRAAGGLAGARGRSGRRTAGTVLHE